MPAVLKDICVYPIKSTQGYSVSRSWVQTIGLANDRRLMLIDEKGRMLTGRAIPALLKIAAVPVDDGLIISHPEQAPLSLSLRDFSQVTADTHVWKDEFSAPVASDLINKWFSKIIGRDCKLVYCGEQSVRFSQKAGTNVSFADAFGLLLISNQSLQDLNRRSTINHQMAQFRPNLVVDADVAFAEDGWSRIRIGEVEFKVDSPCSRCIFTTRHPQTGEFLAAKEPLATLGKYRKAQDGKINFGMNLTPLNSGVIDLSMPVEILSERAPESYAE